jgi:hypothetical protein
MVTTMANTTGNWADQYKDPRWQKKRLEIMERDGFKCRSCGSAEKTLNVHHAYYEKGAKVWEYPEETMITWCEDCHGSSHKTIKDIQVELLELSSCNLDLFYNLICMCGASAAVENLNDAYAPVSRHSPVPECVVENMEKHMVKNSEAFMVLFSTSNPEPLLEALTDANANYGFSDMKLMADAVILLAKTYGAGAEEL